MSNGRNVIWAMIGTVKLSPPDSGPIQGGASLPSQWFVAGTGDFDGDGNWDILWRNENSGVNVIWTMDGRMKR